MSWNEAANTYYARININPKRNYYINNTLHTHTQHTQYSTTVRELYLGNVVDEVLVTVLRVHLAQLRQPLQVAPDLVLLSLQCQAVVHHRLGPFHLLRGFGISNRPPLHRTLVLHFLSGREMTVFMWHGATQKVKDDLLGW